jgi:predicted CopG family antitoxin
MPQKTIYVKDEHLKLWEEVKELIGDESLSEVVVEGLQRVIDSRKAALDSLDRIELVVGECEGPNHRIAFYGRELACHEDDEWLYTHTAYITKKGKLLIYTEAGDGVVDRGYKLFNTFTEAGEEINENGKNIYPPEFLSEAAEELGETYVVELDV